MGKNTGVKILGLAILAIVAYKFINANKQQVPPVAPPAEGSRNPELNANNQANADVNPASQAQEAPTSASNNSGDASIGCY